MLCNSLVGREKVKSVQAPLQLDCYTCYTFHISLVRSITPAIKHRNPAVGARRSVPRLGGATLTTTIHMFTCLRYTNQYSAELPDTIVTMGRKIGSDRFFGGCREVNEDFRQNFPLFIPRWKSVSGRCNYGIPSFFGETLLAL